MTRIKVLHIIKSLGRGGAEMLLPETLKVHDASTFDFHYIYFLPWKNQMVESLIAHGGRVTCIAANNNISLMLRLCQVKSYIETHKIDIIHAHLPWAGIVARAVGKLTGIPVIYTEHNKQERYHFATRIMNLATMNWLSTIVAVSADVASSIQRHKARLKCDLKVILNGVNTRHFSPGQFPKHEVRRALKIPDNSIVIGTVAVFRTQKRLDVWMDVAQHILHNIPTAHFIIVGDGPLKAMLLEKRKEMGLEERIHFVGLQTEVRPYFSSFDIYMMSSVFEGLPIALLEAMSSGCPVVSTDAGGIKEVVRHNVDGMLCPVEMPQYLEKVVRDLYNDSDKLKHFAASARQRVQDLFSMEIMVTRLEELYKAIKNH